MKSAGSDALPKCRSTAQSSESTADVENLGKYSSSTHMDYMRLSQSRWTQMLAIVSQMSSSTEHQVLKSLANLAYEVRHSTSFRTILEHLSRRGRGNVFRIIEKIGKIARFYRSAITFVRVAVEFCSNSEGFTVEAVSSKLQCVNVLSSRMVDQLNRRLPPSSTKLKTHAAEANGSLDAGNDISSMRRCFFCSSTKSIQRSRRSRTTLASVKDLVFCARVSFVSIKFSP